MLLRPVAGASVTGRTRKRARGIYLYTTTYYVLVHGNTMTTHGTRRNRPIWRLRVCRARYPPRRPDAVRVYDILYAFMTFRRSVRVVFFFYPRPGRVYACYIFLNNARAILYASLSPAPPPSKIFEMIFFDIETCYLLSYVMKKTRWQEYKNHRMIVRCRGPPAQEPLLQLNQTVGG